jgi:hypothetical protein
MNIYAEALVKEVTEEAKEGIKVGGRIINAVRFADDQAMLGSSIAGLQWLMNKLTEVAEEFGMSINIKKTKIMRISKSDARKFEIKVNGQCLEQVSQFKYLGSTITEDGRCQKEVRIRIAMAKEAFNKRKCLLSRKMNRQLKKRIIKSLI